MSLIAMREPRIITAAVVIALMMLLHGCASTRTPAPVSDRTPSAARPPIVPASKAPVREPDPRPEYYIVKKGDTLYTIALDHGLDYKELAEWNRSQSQCDSARTATAFARAGFRGGHDAAAGGAGRRRQAGHCAGAAAAAGTAEFVKSQPKAVKLPYSDQALAQLSSAQAKPVTPAVATEQARAGRHQ